MRVRKSTFIPGRVGAENSDLATLKIRSLMISIYFRNIYKLIIIKWSIYSLNYIKNYVFPEKFLRVGRSATFPGRVGTDPTCVPGRNSRPGKIRSLGSTGSRSHIIKEGTGSESEIFLGGNRLWVWNILRGNLSLNYLKGGTGSESEIF